VYWWSNIAVPEEHRVIAPAREAWHYGYEKALRRVPVPELGGTDRTYPLNSEFPADYFYEVEDGQRRWITALDGSGHGLVQTSTDVLRGRKLFLWGSGTAGRRWQEWLTEPGTGGYAEIQAGLARTQLEHVRLDAAGEISWLEAYGPLAADAGTVHSGGDWGAVVDEVEGKLERALPRADVEAAYEAWRAHADAEPGQRLAVGSGWGALEVLRTGWKPAGTPFDESTLGEAQAPWRELLETGLFPEPRRVGAPGPSLVAPAWRDMLETAPARPLSEYHLGVAQWHAGDRAQAVRSWERGLELAASDWPFLRCLAVADATDGHLERAADRYAQAFDDLCAERRDDGEAWTAATAALGREAIEALLAVGRTAQARSVRDRLHAGTLARGRFRLLEARLLLAEGDRAGARAVFEAGFEVADLREGAEVLGEIWAEVAPDEPLPSRYDFRMRPPVADSA
jgi:tetratricopeptide (TPR) repeat protein